MKRNLKKIIIAAVGLAACMTCLTGCVKPYDTPEFVTIEASQTAFLIPLTDDTSNQASFASEELLEQAKVATKEIQIPHRWVQRHRIREAPHSPRWFPPATAIKANGVHPLNSSL